MFSEEILSVGHSVCRSRDLYSLINLPDRSFYKYLCAFDITIMAHCMLYITYYAEYKTYLCGFHLVNVKRVRTVDPIKLLIYCPLQAV